MKGLKYRTKRKIRPEIAQNHKNICPHNMYNHALQRELKRPGISLKTRNDKSELYCTLTKGFELTQATIRKTHGTNPGQKCAPGTIIKN